MGTAARWEARRMRLQVARRLDTEGDAVQWVHAAWWRSGRVAAMHTAQRVRPVAVHDARAGDEARGDIAHAGDDAVGDGSHAGLAFSLVGAMRGNDSLLTMRGGLAAADSHGSGSPVGSASTLGRWGESAWRCAVVGA